VRDAVENHALITSRDSVLLELLWAFEFVRSLKQEGWKAPPTGLIRGPLIFRGHRDGLTVSVFYQHAPPELTLESIYRAVQKTHAFPVAGGLIPDLVVRVGEGAEGRWLLVEVKGVERGVLDSARAALSDLLGYRRAFDPVLGQQTGPYGIGIAWGGELEPAAGDEIVLCSPDRIRAALGAVGLRCPPLPA
jgi:hypothetical protein